MQSAKEEARIQGYKAAKEAMEGWIEPEGTIPLSIVFCCPDKRRRDADNLHSALKNQLDGVAAALGVDDSRFRPILLDFGPVGKPGSVILGVGVEIVAINGCT